jgi:hypothetical protein
VTLVNGGTLTEEDWDKYRMKNIVPSGIPDVKNTWLNEVLKKRQAERDLKMKDMDKLLEGGNAVDSKIDVEKNVSKGLQQ